ncbi:MAG: Ig-like domain-containing protein [Pirellulaceae bacterium]
MTITANEVNDPPALPVSDRSVEDGATLSITVNATDPEGDAITYSLGAGASSGASIGPATVVN